MSEELSHNLSADARPRWWNEESYGKWKPEYTNALAAYRNLLGRDPENFAALKNWAYKDYSQVVKLMSLEPEARGKGINPLDFGNEIIDPEELTGDDLEWYEAWREANPNAEFYSGHLDQLQVQSRLYSVEVYRGMNDGTITVDGSGVITVTPEAVETYGGENLVFRHGWSGQLIRAPKDSGVVISRRRVFKGKKPEGFTDEQWDEWMSEQNSDGYTLYCTSPSQKKGIGHYVSGALKDIGLGRDAVDFVMATIPVVATIAGGPLAGALTAPAAAPFVDNALGINEAYFATDPLGVTSGIHWGAEGMRRNLEGAESVMGDDAAMIQGVGRAAAGTALSLFVPGIGWALSAGFNALDQANRAAAGMQSWGDAFINAGISTVASRIGAGLTAGMEPGIATAFTNAAVQGTSTTLQAGLTGRDPVTGERLGWDEAVERGGISALSSFATAGFTNAMGTQDSWAGALQGAAVGGGTSYLSGLALGLEDDALMQNVYSGAASGALSGYVAAGKRHDYYNKPMQDSIYGETDVFGRPLAREQLTGYDAGVEAWEAGQTRNFYEQMLAGGDQQPYGVRPPISADASAWDRIVRWGTNWNVGFKPTPEMSAIGRGAQNVWDFVTPWETRRETGQRVRGWSDSPWGGPLNWLENRERLPAFVRNPTQFGVAGQAVGSLR